MDGVKVAFPIQQAMGHIGEIVGPELVEEQQANNHTSSYTIRASIVVAPETEEQVSHVLQFAHSNGYSVVTQGGGTKDAWGGHTGQADILLSMKNMSGILHHSIGDLMVTALPGTTVKTLQDALGQAGQFLPIDPSWSEQSTIGGMVAANGSGPKRALFGSARDHLIATRVALADGTVIRTGAKVVKNVAGYDMNKLFVGSMGTLGVLTELTFKIRPLPATTGLLAFGSNASGDWKRIQEALLDSQLEPCAAELVSPALAMKLFGSAQPEPALVILFEDVDPSVSYQLEWLKTFAANIGLEPASECRGRTATEPLIEHLRNIVPSANAIAPDRLVVSLKLLSTMTEVSDIYEFANTSAAQLGCELYFSGGLFTGISYCTLDTEPNRTQDIIQWIHGINAYMDQIHGAAIVALAPVQVRSAVSVWGFARADGGLMKDIKQKLDSTHILNRGRFVGGI
ncbi:FAD-binding oxidoreductase [Paenibacillus agricola]|uniref:FAD-binding oxidoreductase n=1 Tax=Paenibacillus agricola TaxID=2716264 RepID=A0ABX0J2H6_9BACL|nr:FAD-binding oxidoreductase [Paenibacillus agricola]NHN29008.1 FAD-binding oxidoreductase [Paenibacillus agricola]